MAMGPVIHAAGAGWSTGGDGSATSPVAGPVHQRGHTELVGAVLSMVEMHERETGRPAKPSYICLHARIALDRLEAILAELHRMGLVTAPEAPCITPAGQKALTGIREWAVARRRRDEPEQRSGRAARPLARPPPGPDAPCRVQKHDGAARRRPDRR